MTMTVKLEYSFEQLLRERCALLGKTASSFIREALEKYLELTKPQTLSAFDLGRDVFGKYSSADGLGSTKRRELRGDYLGEKYARGQRAALKA
jgi:hypothetical protein